MKRIGFFLLVILMLLFVADLIMAWRVQARTAGKVAAIRAAGQPASIAELRPGLVPNDQNAAAQFEALEPLMKGWDKENAAFYETELGKAYEKRASGAPLTDEEARAIRAMNEKYPQIAEGFARAAACNRWASRADFTVDATTFSTQAGNRISQMRGPVRYAVWQGKLAAHDGDVDAAVRKGIEILHVGRLAENEPTITGLLVAIALQHGGIDELETALKSGKVSPEVRMALDVELAHCDDTQSLARGLTTERAFSLDATDQILGAKQPKVAMLVTWKVKSFFLEGLDFYDVALPAAGKEWWEVHGQIGTMGLSGQMSPAVQQVLPSFQAAFEATNRRQALVRSLRVLNALQDFEEKNGRAATGMADLTLPAEAKRDPFSGNELLVKKTAKGWVVYSVGKDGKDDGGTLDEGMVDVGVGVGMSASTAEEEKTE